MAFKIPAQLHRDIEITQFTMDSIVFEKNIGNGASGVADLVKQVVITGTLLEKSF